MSPSPGGQSHERYGHTCRPRLLEVTCPRCAALATATKPSERGSSAVVGDLSPSWSLSDWEVRCEGCPFRAEALAYKDLPPLYWSFDVGDVTVWAWNREHLGLVRRCLLGEPVESDAYTWLATYVPGEWKRDAARVVRAITKHLEP